MVSSAGRKKTILTKAQIAAKALIGIGSKDDGLKDAMLPAFAVEVEGCFPNKRNRISIEIAGWL